MTGLHGRFVLELLANKRARADKMFAKAIHVARQSNQQEWVGRLLVDNLLNRGSEPPTHKRIKRLLDEGYAEQRAGRTHAAAHVYSKVWHWCSVNRDSDPTLRDRAESLLDRLLDRLEPAVAIEHLKWKYWVHLGAGQPWKAIRALDRCAARAREASLWDDYASAIDQQAITLHDLDRPEEAEPLHREARRVASRDQLHERLRISSANLAECLRRLGRYRSAYKVSRKALQLYDSEQEPAGYISASHNHYLIERDLGRASASRTLRNCEALAKKHGLVAEITRVLMARGNEAWDRCDWTRASAYFRQALRVAESNGIASAASGCRYNLALILRSAGRAKDALQVLREVQEPQQIEADQMHRASLLAALLEDTGELRAATIAWQKAAGIADTLEQSSYRTYYRSRAKLLTIREGSDARSRAKLADRADELLVSIYTAPGTDAEIQRRFDAARAFFENHRLVEYEAHAFNAIADRLTARGRAAELTVAARASVMSIITAASDVECTGSAMKGHVEWLLRLRLSKSKLQRLRKQTRVWLAKQTGPSSNSGFVEALLAGFDALLESG